MFRKMAVGSEIDSYCGKCKMVLNHIVTAMVEDQPKRVRCLTCGSDHNHRGAPTASKPGTKAPRASGAGPGSRAKATSKAAANARWHAATSAWDADTVKQYSVFGKFQVDDLVTHSTFGRGVITDTPSPDRIIALFESGEKMLMQGRQRS